MDSREQYFICLFPLPFLSLSTFNLFSILLHQCLGYIYNTLMYLITIAMSIIMPNFQQLLNIITYCILLFLIISTHRLHIKWSLNIFSLFSHNNYLLYLMFSFLALCLYKHVWKYISQLYIQYTTVISISYTSLLQQANNNRPNI